MAWWATNGRGRSPRCIPNGVQSAVSSPLSVDTPRHKRNLPMEGRFEDALKRYEAEVGEGEEMDESLSEAEEEMEIEATSNEEVVTKSFSRGTTHEKNCSAR